MKASEMQTKVETRAESWTLQDVLCTIGSALSTRTQELRSRENAFGCLVADAMFQACRLHGCDGAVINGGFIRQEWHALLGCIFGKRCHCNSGCGINIRVLTI